MKTSYGLLALLFFCVLSAEEDLLAQRFQAIYGTPLNNTFTKVLRSGTDYYVLGSDQPSAGAQNRATVTRLNAQGQLQWTLRLDIASQWNDAVVTPNGDLLVVGHTLPFDANSQSLAARVTPAGSFSWSRSYNVPGRETFHRVVRNPNPDNAAFPYYIVGTQRDFTVSNDLWDDVVLLTLSDAGNLGWKKIYSALLGSSTDDEFARDLEVLPNGDLLLAGNWAAAAVLLRADNTGAVVGGVSPDGTQMSFVDVAQAGSGFIAAGHQFPTFSARLMKFDAGFLPLWQVSLPFFTAIRQVWTLGNSIYVTGSASVGGFDQGVVLKFQDGASAPTLQWMKYLQKGETAYTGGTAWLLPSGDIAFVDGRASGAYFGGFCAFLSVSDPDMTTCMTKAEMRTITNTNFSFNSPCCLNISLTSEPITVNDTMSAVNWREEDVCPKVCTCGGFSKIYVRNTPGSLNQPITCGGSPVVLPCYPGYGYHLTGAFQCDGTDCPDKHQINWTLSGPGGSHSGGFTDNDPFFGIHLLPTYFNQPGIYTLTMNGNCGTQVCSCTVRFVVDCPGLCPCNSSTIQALQANTAKGFATAVSIASCKACFSPLALSDCETVEWYVNSTSGAPIGTTVGKQTLCYTFPAPGTYTVIMVVSRKRPDGSLCEVFTHGRSITLRCLGIVDCVDSKLPNAGFGVKPVAGPLSSGGAAPGWRQAEGTGEPHDVHLIEYPDSQDGWVMGLTGSYTGAGVLSSEAPFCVSKTDTGTLTMTLRTLGDPIPGAMIKVGKKPPGGGNSIMLYTGNTAPWPKCPDASCYTLAVLEGLLPFDDDDWYELRVPYNLSDWQALDSCGDFSRGIPARMAVYVGNYLGEEQQSVGPTRDAILIDNICFRGMTVNAGELTSPSGFLLYPNPTTGRLTLELPAPAAPGTTIRITEPNGRVALEVAAEVGGEQQQVQVGSLPTGMYFVHLLQAGRIVGAERFVKY